MYVTSIHKAHAGHAVDGYLPTYHRNDDGAHFRCARLYNSGWLTVDFGVPAEVHAVEIYGRDDDHYLSYHKQLQLILGNSDSPDSNMLFQSAIFELNRHVRPKTFSINPPILVRYLFIKSADSLLTICEVIVKGYLPL